MDMKSTLKPFHYRLNFLTVLLG